MAGVNRAIANTGARGVVGTDRAAQTNTGRTLGTNRALNSRTSATPEVNQLESLVRETGNEEKLKNLPPRGEDPNEIYSGGFFMDVMDTLNAAQYGVTGVLKGKSFSEGVKTRQSFSDKDALGKDVPGVIAGIMMDIAVDPLTYLGGFGVLKRVVGAGAKAVKAAGKTVADASPAAKAFGDYMGSKFIYRYGQDPLYQTMAESNRIQRGKSIQNVVEMNKFWSKLDGGVQRKVADLRKAGDLSEETLGKFLSKDEVKNVVDVFNEADKLAFQFANYLPPKLAKVYRANVGKYMRRSFLAFEEGGKKAGKFTAGTKPLRAESALFKSKKDLPDEVVEALGEIREAGYPTAQSMAQLAKSVEDMKFFRAVAQKPAFASDVAQEGFRQLPKTARLGDLSGKFVPQAIFDDIDEIIKVKSGFQKATQPLVGAFKYGKVILNPATHARNMVSNLILNSFEGMNPLDPRAMKAYGMAAKEVAKKGKWYKEAQKYGLGIDSFAANEIKGLLISPEVSKLGKNAGKVKKNLAKLAEMYQKEEEFAKMAQYIFQRTTRGLSPQEAWKVAERATFNYAQVTPFIRRVRESVFGYPFITFSYKATPQVVKTALTAPTKISNIGKIKEGIENLSDQKELERERASEPIWIRNGFYIKLPGKDEYGRSKYFDLTYILPFGDLVSGQLFDRGVSTDTGLREGIPTTLTEKLAFPNMVQELTKNEDFFGNKIFKESDSTSKQLGDIMLYLTRAMTPPLVGSALPGGYRTTGERSPSAFQKTADIEAGGTEAGGKQTRTLNQELLRNLGLKINPFDLETQEFYSEQNYEKALETLLLEEGELKEFRKTFRPDGD